MAFLVVLEALPETTVLGWPVRGWAPQVRGLTLGDREMAQSPPEPLEALEERVATVMPEGPTVMA
jgi:hypothetical protein